MLLEIVEENGRFFLKSTKSYKTLNGLVKAIDDNGVKASTFIVSSKLIMEIGFKKGSKRRLNDKA